MAIEQVSQLKCYHCGDDCDNNIHVEEKYFCCNGCKVVFEILNENNLCQYYDISSTPGISQKAKSLVSHKFDILHQGAVKKRFIDFTDGDQTHAGFYLPQVHCSSCIWLLENLHRINESIISTRVNFSEKKIKVVFKEQEISLAQIAALLALVGYEPHVSMNDLEEKNLKSKTENNRVLKIGIAGFCFGNIMMLAFPDYFSGGNISEHGMKHLFSYISLALSLPVFFYCAQEFFSSAYKSLQQKFLNIDAPIAVAILVTFARSVYEIVTNTGNGYLDSMSGIVFFMLIGRLFQDRTYAALSFERNYKSYFPISVTLNDANGERQIPLADLKVGDRITVRNHELICADAILFSGEANIDYSFVTGEALPVEKSIGEIIYAGGKQMGGALALEVVKEVSQSYLTQLWNNKAFKQADEKQVSFIHRLAKYFSYVLFIIAIAAAAYWFVVDSSKMFNVFTATLIVACPCALLLSATFTNGNMLRLLGNKGFYLKNASALEALANADTIVFDKTGTVTQNDVLQVSYSGHILSDYEKELLYSVASYSSHPYSRAIARQLQKPKKLKVQTFTEHAGKGLEAVVDGIRLKLGSVKWIGAETMCNQSASGVALVIGDEFKGCFKFKNQYRDGFENLVKDLQSDYELHLLSGDNESEKNQLAVFFGQRDGLHFNQSPADKLQYIKELQQQNKKVVMFGDGLNDAGALAQSNCGIAVTDDINNFSPACDAILTGSIFSKILNFIAFAKAGKKVIIASFIISIIYNVIGIYFAVTGMLSPVIAAILMPISTISIVAFTTGASKLFAIKWLNEN